MFKLDNAFLEELGLGSLPPVEKNKMLAHIYETLEMRVGMKLAEQMTNEQLDEFESYINRQDEAGALKWLESNFPNYKAVVAEELEKLKSEIRQVAPQIVAQSQENAAANTPQPQTALQQDQQLAQSQIQPQQPPTQTTPMQPQASQPQQSQTQASQTPQAPLNQYSAPQQQPQPTYQPQAPQPQPQSPQQPPTEQSPQPQQSQQQSPAPAEPTPPPMPQQPWRPE
jgi:hypothetical protein